jgi:hypothetical protein
LHSIHKLNADINSDQNIEFSNTTFNKKKGMYKAAVILAAIIILCGYIYLSKPDTVVINEKGRCEGLVNKARAFLQGDKFWKLQLKMANEIYSKSLTPQLPSSSEMQELYHRLIEDEKVLNEKMKGLYTPEEQMANLLRMKADSIERVGKWRLIDDAAVAETRKEADKIKLLIPIIEAKLKGTKPQGSKPLDKPAL